MGNRCRLWTAICHASSKWCGYPGLRAHNPLTSPVTQRFRRTYNCGVKQPPHCMGIGHAPDKGWAWIVMLSSFGGHVIHGFFLFSLGIVHVALLERFQEEVGKTAWVSGIFLGLYSFCGFISAMIVNKWSCRVATMTGGVLMTAGFIITAFVDNLNYVFVSFGLLSGLGAGLSYSAGVVVVGYSFKRHMGVATGFAVSGIGVGMFALSPLVQLAKDTYGYSGLCLMCAALTFHLLVFGALFRPSSLETRSKKMNNNVPSEYEARNKNLITNCIQLTVVMRNIPFACLAVSMMFYCMGSFALFVHSPGLVIDHGNLEADAAFFLSISGICNAACRFLTGLAANTDNISELLLFAGTFSVLGIASVLCPFYTHFYSGQLVFAVIMGTYSGCCYSLLNSLSVEYIGVHDLANAFGILMIGAGSGSFLGPPFAGFISAMIVNKWSCRVATMTGGVLMTSGFVIAAFVDNLNYVFVSLGLFSGLGAGLSFSAGVVVVGYNFERYRGVTTGFAVSGIGVGMFALSPLVQLAKDTYGYSGLCLVCGAITFHLLVFGALFRTSNLEIRSKTINTNVTSKYDAKSKNFIANCIQMTVVMRNIPFACLSISLMFYCIGSFALFVHFPGLVIEHGNSEADAAFFLSISGICNAACRFLTGLAANSDNISELLIYAGSFSVLGIASVLCPFYTYFYSGQLVFAVIMGTYSGCCYSLLNSLSVEYIGVHHLANAYGILMIGAGSGSFLGPPFAGLYANINKVFNLCIIYYLPSKLCFHHALTSELYLFIFLVVGYLHHYFGFISCRRLLTSLFRVYFLS
ncbi:hypothetical protein FSP39_009996 [Pinctada imbricata]|uniref:Uncharacterized protein n=1 Tax=Pinctada imbricata TaxID=66713 RepID=A0AA89C3T0_PINIB|nr:hypothetical protein FSP39_009996 [Pinctada imbricata]